MTDRVQEIRKYFEVHEWLSFYDIAYLLEQNARLEAALRVVLDNSYPGTEFHKLASEALAGSGNE